MKILGKTISIDLGKENDRVHPETGLIYKKVLSIISTYSVWVFIAERFCIFGHSLEFYITGEMRMSVENFIYEDLL